MAAVVILSIKYKHFKLLRSPSQNIMYLISRCEQTRSFVFFDSPLPSHSLTSQPVPNLHTPQHAEEERTEGKYEQEEKSSQKMKRDDAMLF